MGGSYLNVTPFCAETFSKLSLKNVIKKVKCLFFFRFWRRENFEDIWLPLVILHFETRRKSQGIPLTGRDTSPQT